MEIIKKLGAGSYADVYLAILNGQETALKIPNNRVSKEDADAYSINEIELLNNFKNSKRIINIIHYEINDLINHIFIELLYDELYSLIKIYSYNKYLLPITVIKRFTRQILEGIAEIATCGVIHYDLKPENILFTKPLGPLFKLKKNRLVTNIKKYTKTEPNKFFDYHVDNYYHVMHELYLITMDLKISDFGNSFTVKKVTANNTFPGYYPTRYYISPEVLLGNQPQTQTDMWSFGCIVYELFTMEILFNPSRNNNMGINSAHLSCMIQTLGSFKEYQLHNSKKRNKYFNGTLHKFSYLLNRRRTLENLLSIQGYGKLESNFLRYVFQYDPTERVTPFNCLKLPWLNT